MGFAKYDNGALMREEDAKAREGAPGTNDIETGFN